MKLTSKLAATVTAIVLGFTAVSVRANLVGYWNLDESTGSLAGDASGSAHKPYGTISGATSVVGKFGKALNFDGNDLVTISNVLNALSSITNEVTIAFWQYGIASPSGGNSPFGGNSSSGRNLHSHLPHNNGNIYWDAGYASGCDRIWQAASDPNEYSGKWNHWAFTKDAGTGDMKIYHAGSVWHSGIDKTKSMAGTNCFTIGVDGQSTHTPYYRGKIDEFSIWDEALDITAIGNLAGATEAMTITAPVLHNSLTNSGGVLSPGDDAIGTTTVAEMDNHGPDGTASQSSTSHQWGQAIKAIDGNTDGVFSHKSVTHTTSESQPWWKVDLGATRDIDNLVLWNRVECMGRLSNFRVSVLDFSTTVWTQDYFMGGGYPDPTLNIELPDGISGDCVKVQILSNPGTLSLAEVGVFELLNQKDYTQGPGGSLAIQLDASNDTADKLVVSGDLSLGGTLEVTLLSGTLEMGDTFDILDWGSISGVFNTMNLPTLDPGLSWDTSELYTAGRITVVPEPTTLALLVLGALALVVMRITRRRTRPC